LNSLYKNLVFWAIIIVVMILLFNLFSKPRPSILDKTYSDFMIAVENNQVLEVEAREETLRGEIPTGNGTKLTHPKTRT